MTTIRLPLQEAWKADRYDSSRLSVADTWEEDCPSATAYYEERGWDKYSPINHQKVMLPEFGPARYFYGSALYRPVVSIAGRNFRIYVESDDYHEQHEAEGKTLVLEEVDEPESIPNRGKPDFCTRGGHDVQVFGQPHWIQNPTYPVDPNNGNCCHHLVTYENEWGDLGNWNILVGVGDDGLPNVAYFEASCH